MNENGTAQIIQYGAKGMKILKDNIESLEQRHRCQVDIDSLYEFDNKLLIDDEIYCLYQQYQPEWLLNLLFLKIMGYY